MLTPESTGMIEYLYCLVSLLTLVAFFIIRGNQSELIPRDQGLSLGRRELVTTVNRSVQDCHTAGSSGTPLPLKMRIKKDTRVKANHSPSSPPRNHITVRSSRRFVGHTKLIAICFEQENTYSFGQLALFSSIFGTPESTLRATRITG